MTVSDNRRTGLRIRYFPFIATNDIGDMAYLKKGTTYFVSMADLKCKNNLQECYHYEHVSQVLEKNESPTTREET